MSKKLLAVEPVLASVKKDLEGLAEKVGAGHLGLFSGKGRLFFFLKGRLPEKTQGPSSGTQYNRLLSLNHHVVVTAVTQTVRP